MCTFKRPLLLVALEYGAAMNGPYGQDSTRWEAATAGLSEFFVADNGFMSRFFIVGLLRFGHDPDPDHAGTKIPGDTSGLVDGVRLDVPFYDPEDPDKKYVECLAGDRIDAALAGIPAPVGNIRSWTRGGIAAAGAYFAETLADHPEDANIMTPRLRSILLITQGVWNDVTGTMKATPPAEDPAPLVKALYDEENLPTYVVGYGTELGDMLADQVAQAGGTSVAYDGFTPKLLDDFKLVIQELMYLWTSFPICTPGYPRVMVLLDASSGMLNVGDMQAPMGEGGWEQARGWLAVEQLFATPTTYATVAEQTMFGLAVYGNEGEERVLVPYGKCHGDNLAWALDPATSCAGPGCTDPYAGPPIAWTFKNGQVEAPMFDDPTLSQVPQCAAGDPATACGGSAGFLHHGLELVQDNLAAYKLACSQPNSEDPCDMGTPYLNVLITDGLYDSTDAQVQAPLVAMQAAGVTTYVLAVGDLADTPAATAKLAKLAAWGSGGTKPVFEIGGQATLEQQLAAVVEAVNFDPCCNYYECEQVPEPTGNEPDVAIGTTTAGESSGGPGGSSDETGTSAGSDGTGESSGAGESSDASESGGGSSTGAASSDDGDVPTSGGVGESTSAGSGTSGGGEPEEESAEVGCTCGAAGAPAGVWGIGLVGAMRRRRRAR